MAAFLNQSGRKAPPREINGLRRIEKGLNERGTQHGADAFEPVVSSQPGTLRIPLENGIHTLYIRRIYIEDQCHDR